MDKNMIIINKNNLSACLFAPNGYFYIIFLYLYPLIFYKKGTNATVFLYYLSIFLSIYISIFHTAKVRNYF